MTDAGVLSLTQKTIAVTLMLCAPVLGLGLLVGLAVSIFQAATQIQEQSLSFVPKMIAAAAAIVIFGPWMLRSLVTFTTKLFLSLPNLVH